MAIERERPGGLGEECARMSFEDRRRSAERRATAGRGGRRSTDLPTTKQREVLVVIEHYARLTDGEPCPASFVARRMHVHHSTVQEHFRALFRKGWLRAPDGPASLLKVN